MANTLIPGRLETKFQSAAKKKARINKQQREQAKKESELYAKFDSCCSDEMIREVFESISKRGKPRHQKEAESLLEKYEDGEFGFSEALALNELYKVVEKGESNKEIEDE